MSAPRSTSTPKVFGVLSIVFASIILLFSLVGACSAGMNLASGEIATGVLGGLGGSSKRGKKVERLLEGMRETLHVTYVAQAIEKGLMTVMSALLLAIGIGQLRYRSWARQWSVIWGVAGLLVLGAMITVDLVLVAPAVEKVMKVVSKAAGGLGAGLFGTMTAAATQGKVIGTAVLYAPYPILLLIFFSRERVREAMVE